SRWRVAPVGHTGTQGGSAQCWQPTTRKRRSTSGNVPVSTSSTRRHCTPGTVSLACLHEIVQVWQPTQRLTSTTMPQRGVCTFLVSAVIDGIPLRPSCDLHPSRLAALAPQDEGIQYLAHTGFI